MISSRFEDEEILNAKIEASKKFIYYAPALIRSRVKSDDSIPTMGINQRGIIFYNKKFFNSLSRDQAVLLVTHEIMHLINDHHHREFRHPDYKKLSHTLFNISQDIEINQYLEDEDKDFFNKEGWTPEKMNYPRGKAFEEYLEYMKQDIENDRQQNPNLSQEQMESDMNKEPKTPQDRVRQMRIHEDTYTKIKQDIEDALSKSTNHTNMDKVGENEVEVSQELRDLINECIEKSKAAGKGHQFTEIKREVPTKTYDWKTVLKSLISNRDANISRGRDRFTYTKLNRRMTSVSKDVIFPEKFSIDKTFSIVVGIDISGSMGNLVNEMYSRLKSIQRVMENNSHIITVECDTDICSVNMDFQPYANTINSNMGGGTDMEAIPRWVEDMVSEKKIEEPDLIVIMTDNFVPWQGKSKYKNKIAVITNNVDETCPYKQYKVVFDEAA
jgi:predicted metal-dependent peptidase